jgi:hypothetical protein
MNKKILFFAFVLFIFSASMSAQSNQELVNNIKGRLAFSKKNLQNYSWLETTTVFYKGDQKSVKQYQCYYSVDGQLQKVETAGGTPAAAPKPGLRGKIAENKTDDITDYLTKANALIKTYLPPDPAKLQQIEAAGATTVNIVVPNQEFKLTFPNYNLPGDQLNISINKVSQMLTGLAVATYINTPSDVVTFNLTYAALPDGTQYAAETDLVASAENVKIVIVNSGYTLGKK